MASMKVQIIPLNLISTLIVRWQYNGSSYKQALKSVADMPYISWSVWVQLGPWAVSWVNLLFCICENKGADQMRGNLCRTGLETPNTGFLAMRLMYECVFRREALFCWMCLFLIRQKVVTVQKTMSWGNKFSAKTCIRWYPTRSDTNRAVEPQKIARGWNFWFRK